MGTEGELAETLPLGLSQLHAPGVADAVAAYFNIHSLQ